MLSSAGPRFRVAPSTCPDSTLLRAARPTMQEASRGRGSGADCRFNPLAEFLGPTPGKEAVGEHEAPPFRTPPENGKENPRADVERGPHTWPFPKGLALNHSPQEQSTLLSPVPRGEGVAPSHRARGRAGIQTQNPRLLSQRSLERGDL